MKITNTKQKYLNFNLIEYKAYQLQKIRRFVQQIKQKSAFYSTVLCPFKKVDSYTQFQKLPLLEQTTLRSGSIDSFRAIGWENIMTITRSSGSTGTPKKILWSAKAIKEEQAWGTLGYSLQQIKNKDKFAFLVPFEMSRKYSHLVAVQNLGSFVLPIGRIRTDVDVDNAIHLVHELKANRIKASPTRITQIINRIEELGLNPLTDFSFEAIHTGGQIVTSEFRKFVQRKLHVDVYDEAGSNEFSFIGFECKHHCGLHVMPGPNYVEVLDQNSHEPITDSKSLGEVVITNFENLATPLLRYRIGDLGILSYDKCRCGLAFPRLFIRGRAIGTIAIGGTKIYAYEIEDIILKYACLSTNYQVQVKNIDDITCVSFTIEVRDIQAANEVKDNLLHKIQTASSTIYDKIESGSVKFKISFVSPYTLPRNEGDKIKNQFIDSRVK